MSYNSKYDTAVLISGPDIEDHKMVEDFVRSRVANVIQIGDGKRTLMQSETSGIFFDKMGELLEQHNNDANNEKPILVIINTHGNIKEGEHVQSVSAEEPLAYSSKKMFSDLKDVFGDRPLDIIVTSCFGGGARKDIDVLSKGSKVAFLSNGSEPTFSAELTATLNVFAADTFFSIENFYDRYLAEISTVQDPVLVEVGNSDNNIEPLKFFNETIKAKSLPDNINNFIYTKIGETCLTNNSCIERLIDTSFKIQAILDIKDEIKNNQSDILNTLIKGDLDNILNDNSITGLTCENNSARANQVMSDIERVLESAHIPLSVDRKAFCEQASELFKDEVNTEENYEHEDEIDNFDREAMSDHAAIKGLMYEGIFVPNNNFPQPEKPIYGEVLLISSWAQEYCQLHSCPELV